MYPNVGTIALTRLGLPWKTSIAIAKTVSDTEHHVSTKTGISREFIKSPPDKCWGVYGQGNTVSGPTCLAIQAPMIKTLKQHGY